MSVAWVVAARKGDPAAFARMIEHWNPHLRAFVHHVLAGEGSTDRALSAAYVRAYRALPRYHGEHRPGLWLHRIAYLAATDELRRVTRDPTRRRAEADAGRPEPSSDGPEIDLAPDHDPVAITADDAGSEHLFPPGWRRLAPDQRALAVMVDVEMYRLSDAAAALDAPTEQAADRLSATRRVLTRRRGALGGDLEPIGDSDMVVQAARAALAAVPIPHAEGDFWSVLGRRLLAEREAPAAPSIDPLARLAKAHPAEPGFKPRDHVRTIPGDPDHDPVQALAEQADWARTPRPWKHVVVALVALITVAGLVYAAIQIGTSSRIPDGTREAGELAAQISTAMAEGSYRNVTTSITEQDATGRQTTSDVQLTLADDGSWVATTTGTIDQTTYDAASAVIRRVAVVGSEVYATDVTGIAAGPPDPTGYLPAPLEELSMIPSLFRAEPTDRLSRRTADDRTVWTLTRTLPSGDRGQDQRWRVRVDAETMLPHDLVRSEGDRVVRHISFNEWTTTTEVPADTFLQPLPPDVTASTTSHGFTTTELGAVPLLGRGDAVTPGWLPEGYELSIVAVRSEAPAAATSTAGGANPADVGVLSLGFQRGAERITVTTRAVGADPAAWQSPFGPVANETERTLGDGRFNGTRVKVGQEANGRTQLWGIGDDTVFTVAGDLSPDEADRLAASLR